MNCCFDSLVRAEVIASRRECIHAFRGGTDKSVPYKVEFSVVQQTTIFFMISQWNTKCNAVYIILFLRMLRRHAADKIKAIIHRPAASPTRGLSAWACFQT